MSSCTRATARRGSSGATRSARSGRTARVFRSPPATRVSAVDPDTQLAWEKRHRPRAGIAAVLSTIGLIVFYIGDQLLRQDVPSASGLESLVRAAQPGSVGDLPSLRTAYFQFLDTKTTLLLMIGVGGVIGFVEMAWAVGFLGVAARG